MELYNKAVNFLDIFEKDIPLLECGAISLKKYVKELGNLNLLGTASKLYNKYQLTYEEIAELHFLFGKSYLSMQNLLTVTDMVIGILEKSGKLKNNESYINKLISGDLIGSFALTEPNVGSDISQLETCLKINSDNKYILNGKKKWITLGQIADFLIVFSKFEDKGKFCIFIVDASTEGISISPINNTLGLRANELAEITFNNVEILENQIICTNAFKFFNLAMNSLNLGRFTTACGAVGMQQRCLSESIKYASNRQIGSNNLSEFQLIQKMLTEMYSEMEASKLLCLKAASELNNKSKSSLAILNAKYYSTIKATSTSSKAVQIQGANGVSEDSIVSRMYRDSKIFELIEGTTQVHEILIGKEVIKKRGELC